MNFLNYLDFLKETETLPSRIGYGIRDLKTHKLIKFFSNLHLYQELQKWKKENPDKLDNEYQLTNEIENNGKRTFYFWKDKSEKHFPIPKDEKDPRFASRKENRL